MDRSRSSLKSSPWKPPSGWRSSLRLRILASLLLSALIPLLLTVLLVVSTRDLFTQEIESRQREQTRLIADQIQGLLDIVERSLATQGRVALMYGNTPDAIIAQLVEANDSFQAIWLLDADAQLVTQASKADSDTSGDAGGGADSWESREAFFIPLRGGNYYGDVRLNEARPRLEMGLPIWDDGDLIGVIVAEIDLSAAWRIIRAERIGETGYALLVDRRANLIAPYNGYEMGLSMQDSPAVRAQLNQAGLSDVYTYHSPLSGQSVLGAAAHLPGVGWVVLTERPIAEAYSLNHQFQRNAVLVLMAAVALASASFIALVRRFFPPIRDLIETARRITQGDTQVLTQVYRHDELGELANAFNSMMQRQRSTIHALDEARARAEESTRLKSEFIATMSHELRTPLNAIDGFTSVLMEGDEGTISPQVRQTLERVRANSKHLLHLINDMLDFSRLEAGGYRLRWYPCAPRELAYVWQVQMGGLAEQKGLAFQVEVDDSLPDVLISDLDALNKIGINLLGNAIKFTERGQVSLHLEHRESDWAIVVRDSGIGIPDDARAYIFDEFRQVDGSLTRRYGGTGLGLAIVRKLVRLLGGRIEVESALGQGSTFRIILPVQPPGAPTEVRL